MVLEPLDDQVLLSPVAKPGEGRLIPRRKRPRIRTCSGRHAQGRTALAKLSSPSIRTRRRRRSSTVKRPSSNSSAILLYLAEKTKRFLPENTPKARGELLSWLFFVSSGVGPYSGQSFHFNVAAPEKIEYAINRYNFETHRHWKILDDRLAGRKYVLGDTYTIVDMSIWGWSSAAPFLLGAETWSKMANVKRLVDEINAAPGRRSRQQIEGKACLQARVRRRGQAASVSASDAKGGLTSRPLRQG